MPKVSLRLAEVCTNVAQPDSPKEVKEKSIRIVRQDTEKTFMKIHNIAAIISK